MRSLVFASTLALAVAGISAAASAAALCKTADGSNGFTCVVNGKTYGCAKTLAECGLVAPHGPSGTPASSSTTTPPPPPKPPGSTAP